jgi:anti-sigma B factor antagonist
LRFSQPRGPSLHFDAKPCPGAGAITDLQRLTVSLRGGCERQDQCLLFRFTGQLDAYSDKQFSEFITSHRSGVALPVVIDLSRIDFIDSSGLGALVQLAKACNEAGARFLVVGNARVVQTVKLVRLEEFLHLQPDLPTALGQLTAA